MYDHGTNGGRASGIRYRLYEILHVAQEGDKTSKYFDIFILGLIQLNIIAMIVETLPGMHAHGRWFQLFDTISLWIFSVEYACRVWTCLESPEFKRAIVGRLKFMMTPMAIIDLVVILPLFIPIIFADLRILRILRLFRLLRIFKLIRYSAALNRFKRVILSQKEELLTSLVAVGALVLIAASMMYYIENEAQPEAFSSIPEAMWWAIVTFSTVGYGDVSPITPLGKFLAAVVAMLGISAFAIPTGILGVAFAQDKEKHHKCPQCGETFTEE